VLKEVFDMSGGRVAGIISFVLAVVAAAGGVFLYTSRHPTKGLAAVIACAVLVILGVILFVTSRGPSKTQPGS
jgi:glucose uptake protein GlcU